LRPDRAPRFRRQQICRVPASAPHPHWPAFSNLAWLPGLDYRPSRSTMISSPSFEALVADRLVTRIAGLHFSRAPGEGTDNSAAQGASSPRIGSSSKQMRAIPQALRWSALFGPRKAVGGGRQHPAGNFSPHSVYFCAAPAGYPLHSEFQFGEGHVGTRVSFLKYIRTDAACGGIMHADGDMQKELSSSNIRPSSGERNSALQSSGQESCGRDWPKSTVCRSRFELRDRVKS